MRIVLTIAMALAAASPRAGAREPDTGVTQGWVDRLALATAREYYARGRIEEAANQLRQLAERAQLDVDGLVLAGDILRQRGDWPRAEAAFRAAIAADPDRADLHLRLGQALQEQGKPDAADAEFSRYAELMRGSQP